MGENRLKSLITFLNKEKAGVFSGAIIFLVVILFWFIYPDETVSVLSSALRQSTPLVLGALCGLTCERAGVMNIGIEGQMLMSAFISFLITVWASSLFFGVVSGVLAGALMGLFFAFMSVKLRIDQIIGGTIINIFAIGLTGYFYQVGMSSPGKLTPLSIPVVSSIPLIGPVIFNNPPITLLTILLAILFHFVIFKTRWGLRTRAVGEHPKAADTMGINVFMVRYSRLVIAGLFAGLAGSFLTCEAVGEFERGMTNGRGFIALAVMIFGRWTPLGSWGAALLFGLATAVQTQVQFYNILAIPHQFTGLLPYIITIVVLAVFVKRNRPPAALGVSYERE